MDSAHANEHRTNLPANKNCDKHLMEQLDTMLRLCNPYAEVYKMMRQVADEEDKLAQQENRPRLQVGMVIHLDKNTQDKRRYNKPTANEIAVVFKSVDGKPPADRDIVGHLHIPENGNTFRRINTRQSMCDPMTYPLLLPNGEQGWNCNLPLRKKDGSYEKLDDVQDDPEDQEAIEEEDEGLPKRRGKKRKRITQCQFYSSKLSVRDENFLLHGGDLLQQYVTDAYVKTEANRLNFIETHQKELNAASYSGLNDFLNDRAQQTGATVGKKVILPSSFIGSPRAMKQGYQDAMALCGKYGKPTFFLTFTCNPKWQEITSNILPIKERGIGLISQRVCSSLSSRN